MSNIIEINGLNKSFKDVKAVRDLSLKVREGELFAFLGVNGAGKSTTINIICGQLAKDSGSVIIDGCDIENRLDEVYITVNKNAVPGDKRSPFITSGIRLGTAAVTSRGLNEEDMDKIAEFIYLCATDFENSAEKIKQGVEEICIH